MNLSAPMRAFMDYIADLGPRWGLAAETCRLHAFLYLVGRPMAEADIARALELDPDTLRTALQDLADWKVVRHGEHGAWHAGGDPWDLLLAGLEERRRREVQPALETLRGCVAQSERDRETPRDVAERISKLLALVEDLSAIDLQARRLSPGTLRRLVGLGGRAARVLDRARPERRGARSR